MLWLLPLSLALTAAWLAFSLQREVVPSDAPLSVALGPDSPIFLAEGANICVSLPVLLELVFDVLFKRHYPANLNHLLIVGTSLTTSIVSLSVRLTLIDFGSMPQVFVALHILFYLVAFDTIASMLHQSQPDVFSFPALSILELLVSSALTGVMFNFAYGDRVLGLVCSVVGVVTWALFIGLSGAWAYSQFKYSPIKLSKLLRTLTYIISIIGIGVVFLSVRSRHSTFDLIEANEQWVMALLIVQGAFTLCVTILPARLVREDNDNINFALQLDRSFIRFICHHLRTPLNVVKVGLQVLQQELDDRVARSDMLPLIRDMEESCDSATTILDDLVTFESIESGRLKVDAHPIAFPAYVRDILAPMEEVALENSKLLLSSIALTSEIDVAVDTGMFSQSMRSILLESFKRSSEGGAVRVELALDKRKGLVTLRVSDSESKFDDGAKLLNLFDSPDYFDNQGELSNFSLSLWIAKKVMEQHGGHMLAISEVGTKSLQVIIELPVHKQPTVSRRWGFILPRRIYPLGFGDNDRKPSLSMLYRGEPASDMIKVVNQTGIDVVTLPPLHCLVVDDSKVNRRVMVKLLQLHGVTFEEAEDGLQCVQAVRQSLEKKRRDYHAILLDNCMPNMNGPEAASLVRKMGFKGIILGVTGHSLPEDVESFMKKGADKVLIKPINIGTFAAAVTSLLKERDDTVEPIPEATDRRFSTFFKISEKLGSRKYSASTRSQKGLRGSYII